MVNVFCRRVFCAVILCCCSFAVRLVISKTCKKAKHYGGRDEAGRLLKFCLTDDSKFSCRLASAPPVNSLVYTYSSRP